MGKTFFTKMKLLFSITFTILGLSACGLMDIYTISLTPTPPPPGWLTEWLRDPVCQPPCWNGITPGVTPITDTAQILSELPWVKIEFGPDKPLGLGDQLQVDWSDKRDSRVGGIVFSDNQEKSTLSFVVSGSLSITIKEVVEAFGSPSDVLARDCHAGVCDTELIFMDSGMVFGTLPKPDFRDFVKVSPDLQVIEIWFFPPGKDGYLTAFPNNSGFFIDRLEPWEGYRKYKVLIP